jgi:hypothetical protein
MKDAWIIPPSLESLLQKITITVFTTTATIFPTAFLFGLEMVSSSTLLYSTLLYSTLSMRNSYMFNISNISNISSSIYIYIYIYIQFYVVLTYCMCCNRYYVGWKRSSFPST